MADICNGVVSESDGSKRCDKISRASRRRRMDVRRTKYISGVESGDRKEMKRSKIQISASSPLSSETESSDGKEVLTQTKGEKTESPTPVLCPKFGSTSVCGRRRDMEDAVAIHPSFCTRENEQFSDLHYFGVYDGHGCSHVAMKCRERLHELVSEELKNEVESKDWKEVMERSFYRMDREVVEDNGVGASAGTSCRCELQLPERDAAGSTAVVSVVTPEKIVVANCGDSKAVLCRNGKPVPLSFEHKPDRPDEQSRIEAAGGRVICWDVARIFGVLATSRAISDNYLKPYVTWEPEVTITDRTDEDECLILASDGLWDMVSNEAACALASMCLKAKPPPGNAPESSTSEGVTKNFEYDASILLTKVALSKLSTDNISVVVIDLRKNKQI